MCRFTNENLRARKYHSLYALHMGTWWENRHFVLVLQTTFYTGLSLFHTQSAKLSLYFIPQSVFYTQSIAYSLQSMFYTDRTKITKTDTMPLGATNTTHFPTGIVEDSEQEVLKILFHIAWF